MVTGLIQIGVKEEDYYPPPDDRRHRSKVRDIKGGDNYYDYFEWFYTNYGEDLYDDRE